MAYGVLPGIRVTWPAYAEGDTFVQYNVYRRPLRTILDEHTTVEFVIDGQMLIQTPDLFDGYQGAIAIRGSFPWDNTSEPLGGAGTPTVWQWIQDNDNYLILYYDEATNAYKFTRAVAADVDTVTVAASVVTDASVTLIAYWTPTGIGLSVDGSTFTTASTSSGIINSSDDLLDIGTAQGADASQIEVDWLVAFRGTLTNADAATIHAWADGEWGDYAPSFEGMRDLASISTAIPSGLWANLEDTSYKIVLADWVKIAEIDDVSRLYFSDRRVFSRQVYEYAVTVSVTIFDEPFESDKQSPPAADSVTFEQVAIHNVRDETDYGRFACNAMELAPQLEYGDVLARGRTKVVRQYGERDDSHIRLTPVTHLFTDRQDWDALRKFLSKQRDSAAIFQVRPGHVPEGWYVNFDANRTDAPTTWNGGIDAQEVYFDEEA